MSRDQIPLLVVLVPVLIVAIWLKGVQAGGIAKPGVLYSGAGTGHWEPAVSARKRGSVHADKQPGARRNVALR
jgi:hypothetical protein